MFVLLGMAMSASVATSSCLTPEATFSEGDGDDTSSGGGDGDASLGGMNGGDGDGDLVTPADHCTNRKIDADETDTDCGGQDCDPCAIGRTCEADIDCVNKSCTMTICQMPSCTDGVKNATETDKDCGGGGCPACADDKRCQANKDCQSLNCDGGNCAAATCTDRITNGNESDRDCGGDCDPCDSGDACVVDDDCRQPDEGVLGLTTCDDGICRVTCSPGLGDCNMLAADGCETNVNTDLNHCGACEDVCDPDHAVGRCENGMCGLDTEAPNGGCLGNWSDCNNDAVDGCEANLGNDPNHCGACATDDPTATCSDKNGTPTCSTGLCGIDCESGYDDCDQDARNSGCEANLNASILHCGSCDNVCSPPPGESASCDTSLSGDPCISVSCDGGTDCDGFQPCGACNDAVCNDRLNSIANCGGCGISCTVANGTPACVDAGGGSYQCDVLTCSSGGAEVWNDCDDTYQNGCEVNTQSSKFRCGGCLASDPNGGSGEDCTDIESNTSLRVTATQCSAGGCKIVSCASGYADCNGIFSDGCEVNTSTSATHCGGCTTGPTSTWDGGANCSGAVGMNSITATSCGAGICRVAACSANRADCNGAFTDGCEANTSNSVTHCGGCSSGPTTTWDGGTACAAKANATTNCAAGGCSWTCHAGWTDANGDLSSAGSNGCEMALLSVVNDYIPAEGGVTRNNGDMVFDYPLQTSRATNNRRGLILILGNSSNPAGQPASTDASQINHVTLGSERRVNHQHFNGSSLHFYYILDADLPSGAGNVEIEVIGDNSQTMKWTAHVIEVINLDQSAPVGFTNVQGNGGSACNANLTVNTNAGALVVSALNTNGDDNLSPDTPGLTLIGESLYSGADPIDSGADTIAAYRQEVPAGTFNARWNCSDSEWTHVMASFNPEGTD